MAKFISLLLAFFLVVGVASAANTGWNNGGDDITSYNDCRVSHTTFGGSWPCSQHHSYEPVPVKSKSSIYGGGVVEVVEQENNFVIPVRVRQNQDTFKTDDNTECDLCNDNVHQESKPYSGNGFLAGNQLVQTGSDCFVHVTYN